MLQVAILVSLIGLAGSAAVWLHATGWLRAVVRKLVIVLAIVIIVLSAWPQTTRAAGQVTSTWQTQWTCCGNTLPLVDHAYNAAASAQIDPHFFITLISVESDWNVSAVSEAGAIGIAQIVTDWHDISEADARNPCTALVWSARHLRYLLTEHHSYHAAAEAYHGGAGAVADGSSEWYADLITSSAWRYGAPVG